MSFAVEHRVLPVEVTGTGPADLSLALPGFEEEAIGRAVDYDLGQERVITDDREIVAGFERAWASRRGA